LSFINFSLSPAGSFPNTLQSQGGVHGRAPHYFLEHARPAAISLAMPFPINSRHVHGRRVRLGWLCGFFLHAILRGSSPSTSGTSHWRLSCSHVQGISPFLFHEVPESLLNGLPHLDGPFLCPLAPICGRHLGEDAGQHLVVNQTTEQPRFPGPHHGRPEDRIEFSNYPVIERLVTPELDDGV
jgi:hypothetical protein